MIDDQGNPNIIDFGLSKDTVRDAKADTKIVGSKIYMAPEILNGHPHEFACDMWSIGIIIYVMLCGYYPFNFKRLE